MDGGRILRSLLAFRLPLALRATQFAMWVVAAARPPALRCNALVYRAENILLTSLFAFIYLPGRSGITAWSSSSRSLSGARRRARSHSPLLPTGTGLFYRSVMRLQLMEARTPARTGGVTGWLRGARPSFLTETLSSA